MQKLNVIVTLPDGRQLFCGEIFTTIPDTRGRIQGSFRYTKEYLSHPDSFCIDPVHLPLGAAEIETDRPQGVHGVFEDALPDDWGRRLLSAKYRIPRAEQTVPNLLKFLGTSGLGALSFYSVKKKVYVDPASAIHDLSGVVEAALNFDAGLPVDENDLNALFRQMVFNAAISNTDDHLKNFAMLYTDTGFYLSPAYDLLPDIYQNREHRLSFPQGAGTLPPDRKIFQRIGKVYKVSNPDRIMNEIYQAVSLWQGVFEEYGVPKNDIERLEPAINRGLSRLDRKD